MTEGLCMAEFGLFHEDAGRDVGLVSRAEREARGTGRQPCRMTAYGKSVDKGDV
jgi:hypothetical protein